MRTSESVVNIYPDYIKFLSEVKNPVETKEANMGYKVIKYAPLDEMLDYLRPILTKHNMGIIFDTDYNGFVEMEKVDKIKEKNMTPDGPKQIKYMIKVPCIIIRARLIHASGEWMELEGLPIIPDSNQEIRVGAAISYGKRYATHAICGTSSTENDNALMPEYDTIDNERQKELSFMIGDVDVKKLDAAQNSFLRSIYNHINKVTIDEYDYLKHVISQMPKKEKQGN